MIRKVAVTGGSGFLGKAIIRQCLSKGWEVCAIARNPCLDLVACGVDFSVADISKSPETLSENFKGVDVVFHVAAKTGVWGKPKDFKATNVIGTQNVILACKKSRVKNLVYTSTPSVVFDGEDIDGGEENLPYCTSKLSLYALTKAEAEKKILSVNGDELRTVAIRPHLIWGLEDPHIVPRIIEQATQGRLRIVGNGENKIDLTHVENAAHAHILAAESLTKDENSAKKIAGKAYFVSDGAPVVLWTWVNDLLKEIGIPQLQKDRAVPFRSAYAAGAFLELFWKIFGVAGVPPMTRFVASVLVRSHWFNISAARHDLGYKPIVDPSEKLLDLINFYKGKS